jgi:ribosomal peptide maturation radical SAM protein 1
MQENHPYSSDYCFVLMPNVAPSTNIQPATGLGLLSAYLKQAGYQGQVVYANLQFIQALGFELAEHLNQNVDSYLGDWLFAHVLFPEIDTEENVSEYMQALKKEVPGYYFYGDDSLKQILTETRRNIEKYLDELVDRVIALKPRLVGCGVTHSQYVPALAFMKKLREKAPSIVTVLGGPSCETQMGATTHREFPWLDYVVSGEGDDIIVPLMAHVRNSRGRTSIPLASTPRGLFVPDHREEGYPPVANWLAIKEDLDDLPLPDYDDFFREIAKLPELEASFATMLPFEASRGCWWAQKKACSFCSVNQVTSKHRVRQTDQVQQQITDLAARYGLKDFFAVDSMIDMKHIKQLMPRLAEQEPKFNLFFEVTARLKRSELQAMAAAGVTWVQPGIESLDSRVLKLINKGSQAWQNIQFLRYARELGMFVTWPLLYGFPEEQDEWYGEMADFIPLLTHLHPPAFINELKYMRNSVYFNEQEKYGLRLRPFPINSLILPVEPDVLKDIVYLFENAEAVSHRGLVNGKYQSPLGWDRVNKCVNQWKDIYNSPEQPVLLMTDGLECLEIVDTRPVAVQARHSLTGLVRRIYLYCDAAPQKEELVRRLSEEGVGRQEVEEALTALVEAKLLLAMDGRWLALAVWSAPPVSECFIQPSMAGLSAWATKHHRKQLSPPVGKKAESACGEE